MLLGAAGRDEHQRSERGEAQPASVRRREEA
jgi:hypothetical protein